jgi:hypothetical protein
MMSCSSFSANNTRGVTRTPLAHFPLLICALSRAPSPLSRPARVTRQLHCRSLKPAAHSTTVVEPSPRSLPR